MPPEKQVCSVEWSKKLKELGVPQKSYFYWRKRYHTSESFDNGVSLGKQGHISDTYEIQARPHPRYTTADVKWNEDDLRHLDETQYAAFTVAELGEILKNYTGIMPAFNSNYDGGWYYRTAGFVAHEQTEANARAACLVYLLENGIITSNEINKGV